PRPRRMGIWPYVILGMCVAGVLVLAWAWMQSRVQNQTPPAPPITGESPLTKDQALLEQAKVLADKGDLEGAHAKLAECTTDTIQTSADFVAIETRWAKDLLDRADREPIDARKEDAKRVEATKTAPVELRNRASAMLRDIEQQQLKDQQAAASAVTASATAA